MSTRRKTGFRKGTTGGCERIFPHLGFRNTGCSIAEETVITSVGGGVVAIVLLVIGIIIAVSCLGRSERSSPVSSTSPSTSATTG